MTTCKNNHEFQFPAYAGFLSKEVFNTVPESSPVKLYPVCPTCGERV